MNSITPISTDTKAPRTYHEVEYAVDGPGGSWKCTIANWAIALVCGAPNLCLTCASYSCWFCVGHCDVNVANMIPTCGCCYVAYDAYDDERRIRFDVAPEPCCQPNWDRFDHTIKNFMK
jgi:hypothetical protein